MRQQQLPELQDFIRVPYQQRCPREASQSTSGSVTPGLLRHLHTPDSRLQSLPPPSQTCARRCGRCRTHGRLAFSTPSISPRASPAATALPPPAGSQPNPPLATTEPNTSRFVSGCLCIRVFGSRGRCKWPVRTQHWVVCGLPRPQRETPTRSSRHQLQSSLTHCCHSQPLYRVNGRPNSSSCPGKTQPICTLTAKSAFTNYFPLKGQKLFATKATKINSDSRASD